MTIIHMTALQAVAARIKGEWDNPALAAHGPLSTDALADIKLISEKALTAPARAYPPALVQAVASLLALAKARGDAMDNEDRPGGPRPPTGDDYNDLYTDVMELADVPVAPIQHSVVFVATFQHKHGADVSVYASAESAEFARRDIAAQYWDRLGVDEPKPTSPKELADRYFEIGEELGDEFFTVEERHVEGSAISSTEWAVVIPLRVLKEYAEASADEATELSEDAGHAAALDREIEAWKPIQIAMNMAEKGLIATDFGAPASGLDLDDVERDTILAALRLLQDQGVPSHLEDIATDGGRHDIMSDDDIDVLCERINLD